MTAQAFKVRAGGCAGGSLGLRGCGFGLLLGDELHQRRDRVVVLPVVLVVLLGAHAELLVERERELKGVDRIEAQAFAEERGFGLDAGRFDVLQGEGLDDDLLDAAGELFF